MTSAHDSRKVRPDTVRRFEMPAGVTYMADGTTDMVHVSLVLATDYDALHAQLERARELLDICYDNLLSAGYKNDGPTLSGLTDFLKSLEDK